MQGLKFIQRMHSNGYRTNSWVLASYHPAWSITWLWAFYWAPAWRFFFMLWRKNGHGSVSVGVPLFGRFDFYWQEAMPRRPK